jgi:hypothetical protein
MSEYNAYGEMYDQRPELIIHERLKNSGTVREIIDIASKHNFNVYFDRGPIRQDMIIKHNGSDSIRPESHTVTSGLRYFRRMNDWYS